MSPSLIKPVFDVLLALFAFLLALPVLLLSMLLILCVDRHHPLFLQARVGLGKKPFVIIKLRTMKQGQVSGLGRVLRQTGIDELPQLLNVLRGDMSLVGPRPHALGSRAGNDLFWQASKKYWLRHALKPGITGLAQIRGFRGATEHAGDLEKRVRCDLEYLTNWSIGLDLIIMIKTINVVVHKNAY